MTEFYEYVSLYHPDRLCDYLVSCLLDYCIKKDKYVDFRVEAMKQENVFLFTGFINSNYNFTQHELQAVLEKSMDKEEINGSYLFYVLNSKLEKIERPLTGTGIYYGLATKNDFYLPEHYILTKSLSDCLEGLYHKNYYKSSYTFSNNELIVDVTFTNPRITEDGFKYIFKHLKIPFKINIHYKDPEYLLGMSGRKLGIDYYNSLIPNNGGSPWGKDPFNNDLTLNIYARKLAINFLNNNDFDYTMCRLIYFGENKAILEFYDDLNKLISKPKQIEIKPDLYKKLGLSKPIYAQMCRKGFVFQ